MFTPAIPSSFALADASAGPHAIVNNAINLPFAKQVNLSGSVAQVLQADQQRAAVLRARGLGKASGKFFNDAVIGAPVQNQVVTYVVSVGVGSPATTYDLVVDTGSSNTWVGASKHYTPTSVSVKTSDSVSVTYGSGSFSGTEYKDLVTLATGLEITSQSIGVASQSQGFQGVDGILGIGPVDLTYGTLPSSPRSVIPTVTDNLFSQRKISANLIGISFRPTNQRTANNGVLTFGGVDKTKFTGAITYASITPTMPASQYWGIDQAIRYGPSTPILSTTAGIVDTGTTLVLIASDAFARYKAATGAVFDTNTGLLKLSNAQFSKLQSMFFIIGGTTFEFTANAQAWPRSLNNLIGGTQGFVYLIVNDIGSNTGEGLDFINGFAFLERFYSVFDTTNKRVGFATTPYTTATTN